MSTEWDLTNSMDYLATARRRGCTEHKWHKGRRVQSDLPNCSLSCSAVLEHLQ